MQIVSHVGNFQASQFKLFQRKIEQAAVIRLEVNFSGGRQNFFVHFEEFDISQAALSVAFLRPRVTEIYVEAVDFAGGENFRNVFDIEDCQPDVGEIFFKDFAGGGEYDGRFNFEPEEIYLGIFFSNLREEISLAETQFDVQRIFITKNFAPVTGFFGANFFSRHERGKVFELFADVRFLPDSQIVRSFRVNFNQNILFESAKNCNVFWYNLSEKIFGGIFVEEIIGKVNTAVSFAKEMEDEAREQIRRMCDYEFTRGSKIRIMPDVHAGAGCTIGTTMTVSDKAVPNVVGVDIGCGMFTVKLDADSIDFEKFDEAAHKIPSGKNVWESRGERFELQDLFCYRGLKDTRRIERSIGTLGGGNHFIEIDRARDGTFYLVIHSGSRNLGKQVAEIYQKMAVDLAIGKEEMFKAQEKIISEYKAAGRRSEIQEAIKELHRNFRQQHSETPHDLCFVYGKYLAQYLHDVEICQHFARLNRERMAEILLKRTGISAVESFHTIHNYINTDEMILRKGAIAAHSGERVLIPINMRDGSVLAVGKGNADWNFSAPHGAGRIMSRSAAKERLSMSDYQQAMEGIYSTSVNEATLDESPQAYKSLEDILDVIGDAVEIVEVMKPVYNFKAG